MRQHVAGFHFLSRWRPLILTVAMAIVGFLLLPGCPEAPQMPTAQGVLWLQFAQITDTHVLDDESPARVVRFADLSSYAWRPQEAYTTQVLDATVRVLNEHHTGVLQPQHHLDFVIHTGDTVDNAQYNELHWFTTIMDGGDVTPDSGVLDGSERAGATEDNPKLPFHADGLLPEIPWYVAYGNHDALSVGTLHITSDETNEPQEWVAPLLCPVAGLLGLHQFDMNWLSPVVDKSSAIILGNMDVADPDTLKLQWDLLDAGSIPPDPARHFIDPDGFIQAHLDSATEPPGHGLNRNGPLHYSVRPKPDVPIRLIVLDTAAPSPANGWPCAHGVMMRDQFEDFLKPEFEAAKAAGEWVLLATHHPSSDFNIPYGFGTVGTREFRKYLASQSNMIAHICGHTHRNHFEMIAGDYPYPEIETASLIDYPQEARIIGLYYIEETHNFRVESTLVSHMEDPSRLSEESFRRASIFSGDPPNPDDFTKRYNVTPEELYPSDSEMAKSVREERIPTRDEAHGRVEDRDFSVVLTSRPFGF